MLHAAKIQNVSPRATITNSKTESLMKYDMCGMQQDKLLTIFSIQELKINEIIILNNLIINYKLNM